jgi:hypothetical protein
MGCRGCRRNALWPVEEAVGLNSDRVIGRTISAAPQGLCWGRPPRSALTYLRVQTIYVTFSAPFRFLLRPFKEAPLKQQV